MNRLDIINKLVELSDEIRPYSFLINQTALPEKVKKRIFEEKWLPIHRKMSELENQLT